MNQERVMSFQMGKTLTALDVENVDVSGGFHFHLPFNIPSITYNYDHGGGFGLSFDH